MKKILSLFVAAFMLLTIFAVTASADDLFDVEFVTGTNVFLVSASTGLTGTNRVVLIVQDSQSNNVYMDTKNAVKPNNVSFTVNLGDALEEGTYTFILSSDGDTTASQTKTCVSTASGAGSGGETPDPGIVEADFFTATFDPATNIFTVTGEITKANGDPAVNRIALLAYEPQGGAYEVFYMDALNAHTGTFTFSVPYGAAPAAGSYRFIISSDGDVLTSGIRTCAVSAADNFVTSGTVGAGSTISAVYTLGANEAAPVVVIAVYKNTALVNFVTSNTAVNGEVTAELVFGAEEDTTGYTAKAFAWESFDSLRPITEARSFG